MRVGDYLRYDRFKMLELTEPLWGVITHLSNEEGRAAVLLRGSSDYDGGYFTFDQGIRSSEHTRRVLVAQEDAPDEVVAEEARRALLGVRHG